MASLSDVGYGVTAPGFDNSLIGSGVTHFASANDIVLPGSADSIGSNSVTIPTNSGVANWLDTNIASPILKTSGLGNLFGGDPTSRALDAAGLPVAGNSGSSSNFWTDLFLRAVVIILGFIFVAVALTMFSGKGSTTIVNTIKGGK